MIAQPLMIPTHPLLRRLAPLPVLLLSLHCSSPSDSDAEAGSGGTAPTAGSTASAGTGATAGGATAHGGSASSAGAGATTGGAAAHGGVASGGTSAIAGGGSGGASGGSSTAGASSGGHAGNGGGGAASGGSGGQATGDTIAMTIPMASNGQGEIRNDTTLLKNAKNGGKDVWDFTNQRIGVKSSACESGEDQTTVFEVEDGVTVRNLIIAGGSAGGNGIVCKGNCTLEYVYWEDVCEDAATNTKDGATMTLDHVIALHATDKVFQHNAKGGSKTIIRNSYISDFGKLWRSCGDCEANGGPRHLVIENVRVDGVRTAVAGANRNYNDTVTMKNLFVKGGYNSGQDKPRICTEYNGVTDHNGESTSIDGGKSQWGTAVCKVAQSDVKSY